MVALGTPQRNALPASDFALPGKRAYPITDANHARNALARASQQFNAGHLSGSDKSKIDARANAMLEALKPR